MFINLKYFSDLYDAITSAISGQYEGIFKSKAEARPFAEAQEAKTPLERVQIEEVFSRFTYGNGSESADVKGLAKEIPIYAIQRRQSNNDSLNREERKTAFSTKWLLPSEIQISPDTILLSESLPLQSELYSDEFKSHKIRAAEEKGVLPSVIYTQGVSGLTLPGKEISILEEAEPPMKNLIPEALKPTQDPPQLFTKLFQLGLDVLDTFGMVITTEKFRDEYLGYQKQKPFTSERTKEEDKDNKSVKIRTYADDSTIKRFQTKMDSKFMVGEFEPVPFLIPIGQAHSVLPPLSLIQEVTENLTDRLNSNEITPNNFTDRTNQSKNVIESSFRPEMLPSQPPGEAEIFDKKSSLQKERESYLLKSNGEDEIKADISLVISKEGKEDLSTLQVPLDERREREQLGIDPSPSKSRRPVDNPRYNGYRLAKSSMVGPRNQASGEESGLASENNGAGKEITQRSEALNVVVPKSSLHGIVTQQVSPSQQNHR